MPYIIDLETPTDSVYHILQNATNTGKNQNKPFYVVPDSELKEVSI